MLNFMNGLIGPYGGTTKSELWRPVLMAFIAIGIAALMLMLLALTLLLCGEWVGPVLLAIITLLERWPHAPGREFKPTMQQLLDWGYWIALAITIYTVTVGFPISWYLGDDRLWLVFPRYSTSYAVPLWLDQARWLMVVLSVVAVGILALLESRLLTEILFPALANSVRAQPGLLSRLFPFLKIRYNAAEEEPTIEDSIIPEVGQSAPWLQ